MSYPTELLKCNKCGRRLGTPIDRHQHEQLCKAIVVTPVDTWGRRPLFQAKVGTLSGSLVLVKRARRRGQPFEEHERIEFIELNELQGTSKSMLCVPWHAGYIWKVEDNRIFINR